MTKIASVAEVQRAGVTIEAEEAVAIAQRLIAGLRSGADSPREGPYGPPTTATVYLVDDGSIVCRGCEATPAVSEIAILLQAMLPHTTRVPGGLRYAIARALLDVDVPPYDSLDDFSETLARFERGPRDQIISGVLQRLDTRRALVPLSVGDRRRHPHATELRRALREADARLYLHKVATEAVAITVTSRRSRPRHSRAAAAFVAVGLLLIGAGEFIDSRADSTAAPLVASAPQATMPPARYEVRDVASNEPRTAASAEPAHNLVEPRDANQEARPRASDRRDANRDPRAPEKRARASGHPSPTVRTQLRRDRSRKAADSRGVLERLRLNWLRNVITSL